MSSKQHASERIQIIYPVWLEMWFDLLENENIEWQWSSLKRRRRKKEAPYGISMGYQALESWALENTVLEKICLGLYVGLLCMGYQQLELWAIKKWEVKQIVLGYHVLGGFFIFIFLKNFLKWGLDFYWTNWKII